MQVGKSNFGGLFCHKLLSHDSVFVLLLTISPLFFCLSPFFDPNYFPSKQYLLHSSARNNRFFKSIRRRLLFVSLSLSCEWSMRFCIVADVFCHVHLFYPLKLYYVQVIQSSNQCKHFSVTKRRNQMRESCTSILFGTAIFVFMYIDSFSK